MTSVAGETNHRAAAVFAGRSIPSVLSATPCALAAPAACRTKGAFRRTQAPMTARSDGRAVRSGRSLVIVTHYWAPHADGIARVAPRGGGGWTRRWVPLAATRFRQCGLRGVADAGHRRRA